MKGTDSAQVRLIPLNQFLTLGGVYNVYLLDISGPSPQLVCQEGFIDFLGNKTLGNAKTAENINHEKLQNDFQSFIKETNKKFVDQKQEFQSQLDDQKRETQGLQIQLDDQENRLNIFKETAGGALCKIRAGCDQLENAMNSL